MATTLRAKVVEVTSGSRYEDKLKRVKIEVETGGVWNNSLTVADKDGDYHLDREIVVTVETYSENYERTKSTPTPSEEDFQQFLADEKED